MAPSAAVFLERWSCRRCLDLVHGKTGPGGRLAPPCPSGPKVTVLFRGPTQTW